jgi:putative DNA methylase
MPRKQIEVSFPANELDPIAEIESYRKEIYRPIYHAHKWWAQRLGSVFRAITIGALKDEGTDIMQAFYEENNLTDKIVLDPFMGSGTTVGEALKLGAKAIGCDINPVSSFIVEQSLKYVDIEKLEHEFSILEQKVEGKIKKYYTKIHPETKEECSVLYFFWVKQVLTPEGKEIPLFSNYIFSKNAYPKKKPQAKIICPKCFNIISGRYDDIVACCGKCNTNFNPQHGPVNGATVKDFESGNQYKILDLVAASKQKPSHKLYACLVLLPNGKKEYFPIDESDLILFEQAKNQLLEECLDLVDLQIEPGHNTKQVLNYNYNNWQDFFNERQLLCLNFLLKAILEIEDRVVQEQFLILFSGTLEFNNMFCSFKGEGTGAVRHMFNNHILKPERVPLENSIWGTEKSSGTFSTLFYSRLLKAKSYLTAPFELRITPKGTEKVNLKRPLKPFFVNSFESLTQTPNSCMILNGDSSKLGLPDNCIDAVITDPPYFDFVHYSELSDFFYAWLKPILKDRYLFFNSISSRRKGEVQAKSSKQFTYNLASVFKESKRVLKEDGVLVFSFHHSKSTGWACILEAIRMAGFYIEKAYPIKAEMSVSTPKNQAKSPINLDALIVCKKLQATALMPLNGYKSEAASDYKKYLAAFLGYNRILSENDKKVIYFSQLIAALSRTDNSSSTEELCDIVTSIKAEDEVLSVQENYQY